jgi:aldose 1-epimerase
LSTAPSEPYAPAPTGAQLALRRGRQSAVVTEIGGGLRSWRADGVELLDTFAPDAPADSYRGKVLAPWPNRVRDGRYVFGGVEHRLTVTEPGRCAALHGLVLDEPFAVVDRSPAAVTLACELRDRPGYPFAIRLEVSYALGADDLAVTLRASNLGRDAAPFGAGVHPYLHVGRADDAVLEVPGATHVTVDPERLLPIGPPAPVAGTEHDFTRPRRVGPLALDACFGDLRRDADGRATVRLAGPRAPRAIEVWLEESFRFVHVYTADAVDDPARARAAIAIEPVTCPPDAFNSGAGLEVLEPGASFTARCGLRAAGPGVPHPVPPEEESCDSTQGPPAVPPGARCSPSSAPPCSPRRRRRSPRGSSSRASAGWRTAPPSTASRSPTRTTCRCRSSPTAASCNRSARRIAVRASAT